MVSKKPDKDALFKFFDYEIRRMEFYDTQRERTTAFLFSVAAAFLGIASIERRFDWTDRLIGIVLVVIGIFGVIFSAKYYFRSREHRLRAKEYEGAIDSYYGQSQLLALRDQGKTEARLRERKMWIRAIDGSGKLNLYWAVLPVLIVTVGVALLVLSTAFWELK